MAAQLKGKHLTVIIAVTILVGTEILGAAIAGAWAAGGLMQLGKEVTWGLMAVTFAAGLWGVVKFVRSAIAVELSTT